MQRKLDVLHLARSLHQRFVALGAHAVEADVLQDAALLLDLYGEDIRARAYTVHDPARGEMMMRPDFTVPVTQMHMAHGANPARYTYLGDVFRRQEEYPERRNEYVQVGYEIFGQEDPAAADADVFVAMQSALGEAALKVSTGDMRIIAAAVAGLGTSEARQAALMRHLWRPRKFRALIERFAQVKPLDPARAEASRQQVQAQDVIGKRSATEINMRLEALAQDAQTAPLSKEQVALMDMLLGIRETSHYALEQLRDLAIDMPALEPALDHMERRLEALSQRGVDVHRLPFEASYGRTSMEYYDGFVFGFYADARPDLPPVATGGRYDALTARLGEGACLPAVGAVIRPDLLLEISGESQ